MSLSPQQLKAREGKLTASRVGCLMQGDRDAILRLYREMIGEEVPADLSQVWPVRLGEVTEKLQLDWYEEQSGTPVSRRGEVVVHPHHPWAAATLDGWDDTLHCPLECKHVGGREPLEVVIDRYQPQLQWQMEVTEAAQVGLSVIMGANAPVVEYIERAPHYAAEMVRRGELFMACVAARRSPVALEAVAAPAPGGKIIDMSDSNSWAHEAANWIATKPFADRCREAEKILKSMVPDDARKCHGHGIYIVRDRASRLSLREERS